MDVKQFLIREADRRTKNIFDAARSLPADKLDWQPSAGSRSALDMLQECATATDAFSDAISKRKIEWDQEKFMTWKAERQKLTTLDELEQRLKESNGRWAATIEKMSDAEFEEVAEIPFPGEFKVVDLLSYHLWNLGYHEGQIYYIGSLLE